MLALRVKHNERVSEQTHVRPAKSNGKRAFIQKRSHCVSPFRAFQRDALLTEPRCTLSLHSFLAAVPMAEMHFTGSSSLFRRITKIVFTFKNGDQLEGSRVFTASQNGGTFSPSFSNAHFAHKDGGTSHFHRHTLCSGDLWKRLFLLGTANVTGSTEAFTLAASNKMAAHAHLSQTHTFSFALFTVLLGWPIGPPSRTFCSGWPI